MFSRLAQASPRTTARIAGVFYLLNFITGILAMMFAGRGLTAYRDASNMLAIVCYVVVTLLFYELFKPVSRTIALVAACFSLIGCALSLPFAFVPHPVSNLVFFGLYCLLTGYLILRSRFLPRVLGGLMMVGGLGWLTFISPSLAHRLSPYNMAAAILAEGALTIWLLVNGVEESLWKDKAGRAGLSSQPAQTIR